ncbi:MAG TPA: UDP-N-acetylmuramoyl-tripeptide--D-alanyl-D-alanine ligase [Candidatus Dormibacteraeota bacterium]|nr:UDP-N-acetylmuramoyl-tripeptide--D-alanyl-D-alanine ligase [Candidatus Dormibacteraeota bacterium]
MRWTLAEVAEALGVAPPSGLNAVARLAGVSIDSRTIGAGQLFFAIHGPRHDGHVFVGSAMERGALAAVVDGDRLESYTDAVRGKLFGVADTTAALGQLARAVRRAWGWPLAGVTGSIGKTTTKEILAALLAARFRVLKSEGNLNNEYGLPLMLMRLEETQKAAVLEMGMSRAGELSRLAKIAEPNVGVVTRVAPVHLEFFKSLDEIAAAKRELIEGLAGEAPVAVLNADDARVTAFAKIARGPVLTFGFAPGANFRAEAVEDHGALGSAFRFTSPSESAYLQLPLAGRHAISNALAAMAAASVWGINAADAKRVFPTLRPANMRGEVLRFDDGLALINDCYNSSPVALAAAIQLLGATPGFDRRILTAGEMLELGVSSAELHRECGQRAAEAGNIDWIIGVQGDAAEIVYGAVHAGHPQARTRFFSSSEEAAKFVLGLVKARDLVLVKGSRGTKMERIVEALLAERTPNASASMTGTRSGSGPSGTGFTGTGEGAQ